MAGERRLDGDFRGLAVADFAHHDDVRVLPQNGAQPVGERQVDSGIDVNLSDPVDLVLDRVLDSDDVQLRRVDALQGGIQRRALAAAGRAGDQNDAV